MMVKILKLTFPGKGTRGAGVTGCPSEGFNQVVGVQGVQQQAPGQHSRPLLQGPPGQGQAQARRPPLVGQCRALLHDHGGPLPGPQLSQPQPLGHHSGHVQEGGFRQRAFRLLVDRDCPDPGLSVEDVGSHGGDRGDHDALCEGASAAGQVHHHQLNLELPSLYYPNPPPLHWPLITICS